MRNSPLKTTYSIALLLLCRFLLPFPDVAAAEREIAYDDGSAEGGVFGTGAVRFTPTQYPVTLRQVSFYSASFDVGFNNVWMYDDDGPDGRPGTLRFGPIVFLESPAYHWVAFDLPDSLQVGIDDGDFYIAIRPAQKGGLWPPLGRDADGAPGNRSWIPEGDTWIPLDPELGNLMIRVVVEELPVPAQSRTWGDLKTRYR
jgi:hypothetical protein